MTPTVVQLWTEIIENGRVDQLDTLLADDAQIVSFKVMLRPLKALQTIIPAMAELLRQSEGS